MSIAVENAKKMMHQLIDASSRKPKTAAIERAMQWLDEYEGSQQPWVELTDEGDIIFKLENEIVNVFGWGLITEYR